MTAPTTTSVPVERKERGLKVKEPQSMGEYLALSETEKLRLAGIEYTLLSEFQFLKHMAEMRGTCDECGKRKIMIAASGNKWLCFDCTVKAKEVSP